MRFRGKVYIQYAFYSALVQMLVIVLLLYKIKKSLQQARVSSGLLLPRLQWQKRARAARATVKAISMRTSIIRSLQRTRDTAAHVRYDSYENCGGQRVTATKQLNSKYLYNILLTHKHLRVRSAFNLQWAATLYRTLPYPVGVLLSIPNNDLMLFFFYYHSFSWWNA